MNYNYNAYPWGRWIKWGIVALVVFIIIVTMISSYNGINGDKQEMDSRWSQVENVMQSRADKINNLVEVAKGYVKHEEKVFSDIANARSVLMNGAADIKSKLAADGRMVDAVNILVENYPDLKANQQFHDLQIAIEGAENRVSVERKRFIESVKDYNIRVTRFPGSIFAKLMGYTSVDYFKAGLGAAETPKVKF